MKKLIQTILFLGLVPAVAIGQTISSQGVVSLGGVPVADTAVRLLASSQGDTDFDTLNVVQSDIGGYYYIIAELEEGQYAPYLETDACPGLHFPVSTAGNDTIYINCGTSGNELDLYVGAYPLDSDHLTWYFMNNISSGVESYYWYIDGYQYYTENVTHTFDEPGAKSVFLEIALSSGGVDSTQTMIVAGIDGATNCEALFFPLQDTLPDDYVYFVNASLGSDLTYFWDFDDGTTSTEQYPTHEYGDATVMYNVCLTITGEDCSDTFCMLLNGSGDGSGLVASGGKPSVNLAKDGGFTFVAVPIPGIATGQNEIENQIPLSVFPNPSTGTVTLEMNLKNGGSGIVKVTDVTGKTVMMQNASTVSSLNTIQINMNNLTDGIYLIQYLGEQNSKVQKVVLQR